MNCLGKARTTAESTAQSLRGAHGLDQCRCIHWLCEEVRRAGFHGAHTHGDIPMPGEKDNGDEDALVRKPTLQFETIHFGHRDIQHEARVRLVAAGLEEGSPGCYTAAIAERGYRTVEYRDRPGALAGLSRKGADLVALDIVFADEIDGGFVLCRELLVQYSHLRLIFLTHRVDEIDRISGLRLGAESVSVATTLNQQRRY